MKRNIITTSDGSKTIQIEDWNEQYHSVHGAINEANHVFIKNGLQYFIENNKEVSELSILEIGFGTGLNCLITYLTLKDTLLRVKYLGVEAYPVSIDEISQLNYAQLHDIEEAEFLEFHTCDWDANNRISETFSLKKEKTFIQDLTYDRSFDLLYFDAFGPRVQPELWEEAIFKKMYNSLKTNGVLVTYSAKGSVRRALIAVGFKVERLPGPPGKREMLRAIKLQ